METVYLILSGTKIKVTRDGVTWVHEQTKKQLQFAAPTITLDDGLVFDQDGWRIIVARADVVKSVHGSGYGYNEFGV